MASTGSTQIEDRLTEFIGNFVRDEYSRTGLPITGAVLAEEIRNQFPDLDTSLLGAHWLGRLTHSAEERNAVVRNRKVKHLELVPLKFGALPNSGEGSADFSDPNWRSILPDIWRAFVFVGQSHRPFFNRNSGRVVFVDRHSAEKLDTSLVEICPITEDVQQQWMKDFSSTITALPKFDQTTFGNRWWITFPEWLSEISSDLEQKWKRFRFVKIVDEIDSWAKVNNVPSHFLFSTYPPAKSRTHQPNLDTCPSGIDQPSASTVRAAILAAIGEMTDVELQALSIPLRHVLRFFTPR